MKRTIGCVVLVVIGMAIGYGITVYERTCTTVSAAEQSSADDQNTDVLDELKGIRSELKDIKAFIKSGKMVVIAPIYPDNTNR